MKRLLFILFLIFAFTPFFHAEASEPTRLLPTFQEGGQVKILLVPGHDDAVWGAQYGYVKEAAMNLAVASRIYNILAKDERFEVHITRQLGGYTQEIAQYLAFNKDDISTFKETSKLDMLKKIIDGLFIKKENPPHNTASDAGALKLYGFNKWANENKVDAMIHIHFNDYPRAKSWTIGEYTGFVIYIPEGQMANAKESAQLAANIFIQLKKKYHTSTYEKELGGLVPDQSLIALGSNGSLLESVRSVLIEYGYVYEKKFRNYTTRHQAYNDMAKLTAAGIQNYFFPK